MLPHREGSCLCQFWEFQFFFTELALARVEVEAACSQEDQQLGVVYAPTTLTNTYNNILKYMLKL